MVPLAWTQPLSLPACAWIRPCVSFPGLCLLTPTMALPDLLTNQPSHLTLPKILCQGTFVHRGQIAQLATEAQVAGKFPHCCLSGPHCVGTTVPQPSLKLMFTDRAENQPGTASFRLPQPATQAPPVPQVSLGRGGTIVVDDMGVTCQPVELGCALGPSPCQSWVKFSPLTRIAAGST